MKGLFFLRLLFAAMVCTLCACIEFTAGPGRLDVVSITPEVTVSKGEDARLSTGIAGQDISNLSYRWFAFGDDEVETVVSNSRTLEIDTSRSGKRYYYVEVTNERNGTKVSIKSNVSVVTVVSSQPDASVALPGLSSSVSSVEVALADGTTTAVNVEDGLLKLDSFGSNEIVKSIKADGLNGGNPIYIGRKAGEKIELKFSEAGELEFREPDFSGNTPLGAVSEIALISGSKEDMGGSYALEADVDFMDLDWTPVHIPNPDYPPPGMGGGGGGASVPKYLPFNGSFDGADNTISNLKITASESDEAGLFGSTGENAVIKNIKIETADVNNSTVMSGSVGVIAGKNAGIIENCTNAGNITVTSIHTIAANTTGIAGGITGSNTGTIINCHNVGKIDAGSLSGGIVGSNSGGVVKYCSNSGTVSSVTHAGGIVGTQSDSSDDDGYVIACFNSGNVSGNYAGGIVGDNNAGIVACINTGAITGGGNSGGIAGRYSGDITSCYNLGAVSAGSIGSIYGQTYANIPPPTDCYYGGSSPTDTQATKFGDGSSSTGWPTWGANWIHWVNPGDEDSGKYWKEIGDWNNGAPSYPKLWWQQ
ncbi:MAG: hypothetical protein LBC77_04645 [Spirochaetaceae bacterium]|nr:hypothetical protein [Spirochaetaceae bacterium]